MLPDRIGPYRITRQIGEGGMGVVYAAHDDRLDRDVAVKLIRPEALANDTALERFRREARAAARVTNPNICILYEYNEDAGRPYLVMELLEGEPLSARIARGALPVAEMMPIALPMLDALAALHRRGIMHRDLKPANVFLTPLGPKLLDFGLAQAAPSAVETGQVPLTSQGLMVGTPQYMAPEQVFGQAVDERADIFAAGAVIYEMLTGRSPFKGETLAAVVHAVGYADPAPMSLGQDAGAVEAVIRRALSKTPAHRPARADALASELKTAVAATAPTAEHKITRQTRLVALPLRVLRPDPDTDFLAFSVPDAVSAALASLESVIVRSPQAAANLGHDVRAIARELSVDVVLTGTILRGGNDVRVSAQLADADGTMLWSDVTQAPMADLFQLQDSLTSRIVTALALPLSARDRRALDAQAPGSAEAYELVMRANQLMTEPSQWQNARTMYDRAVALDPTYAQAWARLGRARRLIAKWGGPAGIGLLPQAEAAFKRALELDPNLSVAHDLSAYVDAELGHATEAMERLLRRASIRPHDAGVFGGLVTTCRYAGLLDESIAAAACAHAIDPAISTSEAWSYFFKGDRDMAKRADPHPPHFCGNLARFLDGELSLQGLIDVETSVGSVVMRQALSAYRLIGTGHGPEALEVLETMRQGGFSDPEGWYLYSYMFARIAMRDAALAMLERAVDGGFGCFVPLSTDPAWGAFRGDAQFDRLSAKAHALVARAKARFSAANGERILRMSAS